MAGKALKVLVGVGLLAVIIGSGIYIYSFSKRSSDDRERRGAGRRNVARTARPGSATYEERQRQRERRRNQRPGNQRQQGQRNEGQRRGGRNRVTPEERAKRQAEMLKKRTEIERKRKVAQDKYWKTLDGSIIEEPIEAARKTPVQPPLEISQVVNTVHRRVWTSARGEKVAATAMGLNDDAVLLRRHGRNYAIRRELLSAADQEYLKQAAATAAQAIAAIKQKSARTIGAAVKSLDALGPLGVAAVPALCLALSASDGRASFFATDGLADYGPRGMGYIAKVKSLAESAHTQETRIAATYAAAKIDGDLAAALPALHLAADHGRLATRHLGISALAHLRVGDERSLALLRRGVMENHKSVSGIAAQGLYNHMFKVPAPVTPLPAGEDTERGTGSIFDRLPWEAEADAALGQVRAALKAGKLAQALNDYRQLIAHHPGVRGVDEEAMNKACRDLAAKQLAAGKGADAGLAASKLLQEAMGYGELDEGEVLTMAQGFINAGQEEAARDSLLALGAIRVVNTGDLLRLHRHLTQRENVTSRWRSEDEWIITDITEELARQIFYAARKKLPEKPVRVKLNYASTKADALALTLAFEGLADAGQAALPPLPRAEHVWSPRKYLPTARVLARELGLRSSVEAPSSTGPAMLKALLDARAAVIQGENRKLSERLQENFTSPSGHEQAALLHAMLALRESSDLFFDARRAMSRATVHLCLAKLLAGKAGASAVGVLAEAALEIAAGRTADAVRRLDAIAATADPAAKDWSLALRLRATGNWQLATAPEGQPLLVRLAYLRALAASMGKDADPSASKFARQVPKAEKELPDWAWMMLSGRVTVGLGHMFAGDGPKADLAELSRLHQLVHGKALESTTMAQALSAGPGPCVRREADKVQVRVIDWGAWSSFYQRHVCHRLQTKQLFLERMLGAHAAAADLRATIDRVFANLPLYPALMSTLAPHRDNAATFLAKLGEQARTRPELLGYTALTDVLEDMGKLRQQSEEVIALRKRRSRGSGHKDPVAPPGDPVWGLGKGYPVTSLWYGAGLPAGTTYQYNHRQMMMMAPPRPDYQALSKLNPWNLKLLQQVAGKEKGLSYSEIQARLQAVLAYNSHAQRFAAAFLKSDPKLYAQQLRKMCEKDPDRYMELSQYLQRHKLYDDAGDAFLEAVAKAPGRVKLSNSGAWAISHFYNRGRPGDLAKAIKVAEAVRDVGSATGLRHHANFMGDLGRLKDAADSRARSLLRYGAWGALSSYQEVYNLHQRRDLMNGLAAMVRRLGDEPKIAQGWSANSQQAVRTYLPLGLKMPKEGDDGQSGVILLGESAAARAAGLRRGDIITVVDGLKVGDLYDYARAANLKGGKPFAATVWRQQKALQLKVPEDTEDLRQALYAYYRGHIRGSVPPAWRGYQMKRVNLPLATLTKMAVSGRFSLHKVRLADNKLAMLWRSYAVHRAAVLDLETGRTAILGETPYRGRASGLIQHGDYVLELTGGDELLGFAGGKSMRWGVGTGLPRKAPQCAAVLEGTLYVGHGKPGQSGPGIPGGVSSFDPKAGVGKLLLEKKLRAAMPADADVFWEVVSMVADPQRRCLWFSTHGFLSRIAAPKWNFLWRYDPQAGSLKHAVVPAERVKLSALDGRGNPLLGAAYDVWRYDVATSAFTQLVGSRQGRARPRPEYLVRVGFHNTNMLVFLQDRILMPSDKRLVLLGKGEKRLSPLAYTPDGKVYVEIVGVFPYKDGFVAANKEGAVWLARPGGEGAGAEPGWRDVQDGFPLLPNGDKRP